MSENILKDIYKRFGDTLIRSGRQNGRSQLAKDLNYLFTRAETAYFLEEQNKRYREAIEYIKIELRDFRKDANTIKKLSRDRIVQGEAFRLSCDIRDCLKALEELE